MKLWKKIILGVVLAVVVLCVAFCAWQCSNIMAVWKAMNSTSDEIAVEMDNVKKELENELQNEHPTIVSDFTAEEEKKIIKGEITYEEAVNSMREKYESQKTDVSLNDRKTNGVNSSEAVEKLIGDKVVELYSLKAYYLGQLGQIEASVKSDYSKLPKEKRNLLGKKTLVDKYMGKALGLLDKCDAAVDKILNELECGLKNYNADTSIVKKIKNAYENEKALKKAYYISLLEK